MGRLNKLRFFVLIIFLFTAGCANNSVQGGGGDLPAEETDTDQGSPEAEYDSLEGQILDFVMNVEVDNADTFQDTIKTEWVGEFSYDSEGEITGLGVVEYEANIFSVNEDGCGYMWTDTGMYDFVLGGDVQRKESGNVYPVKIVNRDNRSSSRSPAGATCDDPGPFEESIMDLYSELHLNGLFAGVETYLHRVYEREIRLCAPIQDSTGKATIYILVCLPAEELN